MTPEEWANKVIRSIPYGSGYLLLEIFGYRPADQIPTASEKLMKEQVKHLRHKAIDSLQPLLNQPPQLYGQDMTPERLKKFRVWLIDNGPSPGSVPGEKRSYGREMLDYIDLLHSLLKDSEAYRQGMVDGAAQEREAFIERLTTCENTSGWLRGELLEWVENRKGTTDD